MSSSLPGGEVQVDRKTIQLSSVDRTEDTRLTVVRDKSQQEAGVK